MANTMSKKRKPKEGEVGCLVKKLPEHKLEAAAASAIEINPVNRPRLGSSLAAVLGQEVMQEVSQPQFLAVLTTKYWGTQGVQLTVSFLENVSADLGDRIVSHMNAWGAFCNAKFTRVKSGGDVRITLTQDGYWSYLGTDIRHIPKNQPTMCLQGVSMSTPESEYLRVVRHETGHTLGFPHEHMRQQIVNRLDRQKTIDYFRRFQGWDERTTVDQVLTPLSESSVMGTPDADEDSIMCYQLPASITKDGRPVAGGVDINPNDKLFAAKVYPLAVVQPPPTSGTTRIVIQVEGSVKSAVIVPG